LDFTFGLVENNKNGRAHGLLQAKILFSSFQSPHQPAIVVFLFISELV